jgi:ISXO2-like transposase domain
MPPSDTLQAVRDAQPPTPPHSCVGVERLVHTLVRVPTSKWFAHPRSVKRLGRSQRSFCLLVTRDACGHEKSGGSAHKNIVLTLVERGGGARSFHIDSFAMAQVVPIVRTNIRRESRFMTDEANQYKALGKEFADHGSVRHSTFEYVRGDIHTNTVEGYYSIFKRGMKGIYQHCSEKHLHRYLAEYDFRYSYRVKLGYSDEARTERALKGMVGKRLTYRQSPSQERA